MKTVSDTLVHSSVENVQHIPEYAEMDALYYSAVLAHERDVLKTLNAEFLRALVKSEQRIVQLCGTCNTLSNKLGLGDKVRAEDFADIARSAIAKAKEVQS